MGSARTDRTTGLYGRQHERARIERLLDGVRSGVGGSLVFVGVPGSGKTALLRAAERAAGDATVLTAWGVDSERDLPFSGLHRLLRPLNGPIGREATVRYGAPLVTALRLTGRPAPEWPAVAAATLELLGRLGTDRPVLLVVDDLQWLDRDSLRVLAFLSGRMDTAATALLGASREDAVTYALPRVPVHRLSCLDDVAVEELLAAEAGVAVPSNVRAELAAGTGGNPGALVELAQILTERQLSGAATLPEPLPLGPETAWAYLNPIRALPADTRQVLLIAATDPGLDAATVARAAAALGARPTAVEAAEEAGLVTVDITGVSFRHPLSRAAAYHSAGTAARRAVHEVLARVSPERSVAYRAAIAWEPSEELAHELATAATRVRITEGYGAAAAQMHRAAVLTPPGVPRARRLILAARDSWLGGSPARALEHLDQAARERRPDADATDVTAEIEFLRGSMLLRRGTVVDAYEGLLAVAARLRPDQVEPAARALINAGLASWYAGDLSRFVKAARRAEALDRCGVPEPLPPAVLLGLDWLAGLSAEFGWKHDEAASLLRRVTETAERVDDPAMLILAAGSAMARGDDALVHALASRAITAARSSGAVSMVPAAIGILIHAECWTGRFPYTTPDALEGMRLARETGQRNCESHLLAMLALAAAIRGDDEECDRNARDALAIARRHGVGLAAALATWALALLDLVYGRWAAAYARLRQLRLAGPGIGHPIVALYATPYFVEAAVNVGAVDEARTALTAYAGWARTANQDGPLALAARGEALLATGGTAGETVEERFRESLEHHYACSRDFERGYTELLYATHLRRNRRRAEARKHLRSALEVFERLELDFWIKRVRAEQRATGERVDTGASRADGRGLTPHQLQIVQHIAEGATNREVAERLFVSPRTVDYHLRNIFTKLGIRSRSELIRRFG